MAVAALGITTWLSFRYSAAVRAHEHAVIDRYKGLESNSAQVEEDVAAARQRAVALEQEVATARGRTAALEQEVSAARERAAALERDAAAARERAGAFEQAAREATEQAAREANERAARESAAASEKARTRFDAAEIRQRLADLGKLVREATTGSAEAPGAVPRPGQGEAAPESAAARRDGPPSPIVASLRKYAGTKAALFVLDPVSDAPATASTIAAYLGDAGWAPQTWKWTGVAGIFGVVVLIKDGSDPATVEAASSLVEALRSAGLNATKGDWPADWRRFRGALDGPQTPGPTEAPIRIVIGAKPR
jgi:hypothetical protein